jgi:hypothetical protein
VTCRGVEPEETTVGGQPKLAGTVLADVNYGYRTVFDVRRGQRMARKGFRHGIEAVEELIGSDSDETRAVLEQCMNVHAAETARILSIMMKHLARIAIKPAQAILRTLVRGLDPKWVRRTHRAPRQQRSGSVATEI